VPPQLLPRSIVNCPTPSHAPEILTLDFPMALPRSCCPAPSRWRRWRASRLPTQRCGRSAPSRSESTFFKWPTSKSRQVYMRPHAVRGSFPCFAPRPHGCMPGPAPRALPTPLPIPARPRAPVCPRPRAPCARPPLAPLPPALAALAAEVRVVSGAKQRHAPLRSFSYPSSLSTNSPPDPLSFHSLTRPPAPPRR
jgi:hypothetical protein